MKGNKEMAKSSIIKKEKEEVLLTFLKKTREGKYAPIEKSSLPYSRIIEERETVEFLEEDFYYSIS